jgi:hypothetical protein
MILANSSPAPNETVHKNLSEDVRFPRWLRRSDRRVEVEVINLRQEWSGILGQVTNRADEAKLGSA